MHARIVTGASGNHQVASDMNKNAIDTLSRHKQHGQYQKLRSHVQEPSTTPGRDKSRVVFFD